MELHSGANRSVVIAVVVTLNEPIAAAARNIFLTETTASPAKRDPLIAVQIFKMQLDQVRIVQIGRKIMTGAGISAHVDHGISHLGRQAVNSFRIQRIVVRSLAAACKHGSIGEANNQNCNGDCRKPCAKSPHAGLPPGFTRVLPV